MSRTIARFSLAWACSLALVGAGITASAPAFAAETNTPSAGNQICNLENGSLDWQIKQSFLEYLTGLTNRNDGVITASDGAQYVQDKPTFTFKLEKGSFDPATKQFTANFAGSVHLQGHKAKDQTEPTYMLDMTFSNLKIETTDGKGVLKGNVVTRPFNDMSTVSPFKEMREITLVDLKELTVSCADGKFNFKSKSFLPNSGESLFGPFYSPGIELSPASVTADVAPPVAKPENTDTMDTTDKAEKAEKTEKTEKPDKTDKPDTTDKTEKAEKTEKPDKTDKAEKAEKAEKADSFVQPTPEFPAPSTLAPAEQADPNKQVVTSGELAWGLRSSFTNYIRTIAKGEWTLGGGAKWNGTAFVFPIASGLVDTKNTTGTINFAGGVHFVGHKGVLDLTIANPTIEFNGNRGTLYLSAAASDMQGNKVKVGRVRFANLAFSNISFRNGSLNLSTSQVTLTTAGTKAFAGYYQENEQLNNLQFAGSLKTANAGTKINEKGHIVNAQGAALSTAGGEKLATIGSVAAGSVDSGYGIANAHLANSPLAHTGSNAMLATLGALLLVASGSGLVMARRQRNL